MSMTILIVEDHSPLRRALRDWLEGVFPQHEILEAADGEEAVAAAQAELPHVVVMDIGLPKLNGIEATRQITASVPGVQVVILSVHNNESYRSAAADAGAVHYIPKDAMQSDLLPVLEDLIADLERE